LDSSGWTVASECPSPCETFTAPIAHGRHRMNDGYRDLLDGKNVRGVIMIES
jgi:hypothetical protein